jgi:hypothetical protein
VLHTSSAGVRCPQSTLRAQRQVCPCERIHSRRQGVDKADELKRLIVADPDLVVFHLLDDDPAEAESKGSKRISASSCRDLKRLCRGCSVEHGSLFTEWTALRLSWRKGYPRRQALL